MAANTFGWLNTKNNEFNKFCKVNGVPSGHPRPTMKAHREAWFKRKEIPSHDVFKIWKNSQKKSDETPNDNSTPTPNTDKKLPPPPVTPIPPKPEPDTFTPREMTGVTSIVCPKAGKDSMVSGHDAFVPDIAVTIRESNLIKPENEQTSQNLTFGEYSSSHPNAIDNNIWIQSILLANGIVAPWPISDIVDIILAGDSNGASHSATFIKFWKVSRKEVIVENKVTYTYDKEVATGQLVLSQDKRIDFLHYVDMIDYSGMYDSDRSLVINSANVYCGFGGLRGNYISKKLTKSDETKFKFGPPTSYNITLT